MLDDEPLFPSRVDFKWVGANPGLRGRLVKGWLSFE